MLLIACFVGFMYLFYSFQSEAFHVCLIKNVTGYPCPSCGTTRAVALLLKGKITESVLMNPFGILVAILMTVCPIWVLTDVVFKKETFYSEYKKAEAIIRKPWIATILMLLVLLNWIWNIYKHL